MSIEVIVSDLGHVLLPFDTRRVWERLVAASALPEEELRRAHQELFRELRLETGGCGGVEFHARLVERCGLRLDFAEFCVAWSDMFWEDAEVIRLVHRAPVRQRVLLSNTNPIHWEFIRTRYPHVIEPFDHWVVSHECGVRKPEAAIYRQVLERTGLPPERHLFIDDLEENVRAAQAIGMEAIVHTDAAALRRVFAERGLLPG